MKTKAKLHQWILIACLVPLLVFGAWCGFNVHKDATERAAMQEDFSHANSIIFGLFSANVWREEVKNILSTQIEEFDLTEEQDSLLRVEISQVLHKLIDQAKSMVQNEDNTLKTKVRKWAVNAFVDWDELRKDVPAFTETILQELKDPDTKTNLKTIATQKIDEYAEKIHADTLRTHLLEHYQAYGHTTKEDFNAHIKTKGQELKERAYRYAYLLLGLLGVFLIPWLFTKKYPEIRSPLFMLSVALAMIVLLTGLTTPMIEIDARIAELDFVLLDRHIIFRDQMLFYRNKSILQVVSLLLGSAQFDVKLVGFLVLAFSVILPISKLISTGIRLLGTGKLARNQIIGWLAFKSGKWSMADVLVVAIFMAYVSFDGILEDQLQQVEFHGQHLTSITTNLTSLEPGFVLFFAYVLYGLVLAHILKWIVRKK